MSTLLKNNFFSLCFRYSDDNALVEKLWREIEEHYSEKGRYYHSLSHLEYMLKEFLALKEHFLDADTALFSLYYHDIIYNAAKNDNEEKSAQLARERLALLRYPAEKANACAEQILATKSHTLSEHSDVNLFTDIDLSILGADEAAYEAYAKAIRKEYSMYPDFLYKPGRKKVLKHLLDMKGMFKTPEFAKRMEKQARENMEKEINAL